MVRPLRINRDGKRHFFSSGMSVLHAVEQSVTRLVGGGEIIRVSERRNETLLTFAKQTNPDKVRLVAGTRVVGLVQTNVVTCVDLQTKTEYKHDFHGNIVLAKMNETGTSMLVACERRDHNGYNVRILDTLSSYFHEYHTQWKPTCACFAVVDTITVWGDEASKLSLDDGETAFVKEYTSNSTVPILMIYAVTREAIVFVTRLAVYVLNTIDKSVKWMFSLYGTPLALSVSTEVVVLAQNDGMILVHSLKAPYARQSTYAVNGKITQLGFVTINDVVGYDEQKNQIHDIHLSADPIETDVAVFDRVVFNHTGTYFLVRENDKIMVYSTETMEPLEGFKYNPQDVGNPYAMGTTYFMTESISHYQTISLFGLFPYHRRINVRFFERTPIRKIGLGSSEQTFFVQYDTKLIYFRLPPRVPKAKPPIYMELYPPDGDKIIDAMFQLEYKEDGTLVDIRTDAEYFLVAYEKQNGQQYVQMYRGTDYKGGDEPVTQGRAVYMEPPDFDHVFLNTGAQYVLDKSVKGYILSVGAKITAMAMQNDKFAVA